MAEMDPVGLGVATNPFPIIDPEMIPAQRYYDEEFYRLECERVWPHVWQMACRLEMIPDVGDWIEYSNVGKSVIVVRTDEGVKAYENHCRHRGVPIAGGMGNECGHVAHGNCAKTGFICPFHGWQWNMHGENTWVYGRQLFSEDKLDPAELALKPVRVETALGCAFINHDPNAPSLRESLGPVVDRLEAHGLGTARMEWWVGTILPANWKICMEAFQEGYHVLATHPQLQHATPSMYDGRYGADTGGLGKDVDPSLNTSELIQTYLNGMELLSAGMGGMIHAKELAVATELAGADLPEDPQQAVQMWHGMIMQQVTERLRASGEDVPDVLAVAQTDPVEALEYMFPHYFVLPPMTSYSSYRIRPLGPESTLFEIWSMTHFPEGKEPEVPMEPTMLPYDSQDFPEIPRQDYSNIPLQQKGMHSTGFEFMRLSKEREGLISNYQRLIDGYIAGVDAGKLAKASSSFGGNFDGPIKDLGF